MKTTKEFPNHHRLVDLTASLSSSSSSSSSSWSSESESISSTALLSADESRSPTGSATRRRSSKTRSIVKESTKSPRISRQQRRGDRNHRWSLSTQTQQQQQQPTHFTHDIAHIIPMSSQEQDFGVPKPDVLYAMGDPIAQRFTWRRILLIILAFILGYIVISELIQYVTWTTIYHDWWYLREAVLNDEFAKRPFLYDVRYFVLANAIQPTNSNTLAQTPDDISKATTGTTND